MEGWSARLATAWVSGPGSSSKPAIGSWINRTISTLETRASGASPRWSRRSDRRDEVSRVAWHLARACMRGRRRASRPYTERGGATSNDIRGGGSHHREHPGCHHLGSDYVPRRGAGLYRAREGL